MSAGFTHLHKRVPAKPQSIAPLRHAVVELARANGASDHELEDIAVAVSEAVTNVVLHAYPGAAQPGVLALEAWMDGRQLQVVVSDAGAGIRSQTDSPGPGHGLPVIHRIAEHVHMEDARPGVRLRMTFAIA